MTKKPDQWMPLNIAKYLGDTTHLTRDQHGAYLLLLMAYWMRGGPLPADNARLAAIVKASPREWKSLRPVLVEFFKEECGFWRQKRADEELASARSITDAKSKAGKKGAEAKWKNDGRQNSESAGKQDGRRMTELLAEAMAEPMANACRNDAPIPVTEVESKKDSLGSEITKQSLQTVDTREIPSHQSPPAARVNGHGTGPPPQTKSEETLEIHGFERSKVEAMVVHLSGKR